ncbi:GntR family transcriptional regulator [Paracoccus sp. DMF-8]|uniref:GntR family transcriptional regulator n=1 Tax=Paracoccus sp. DMF-8 TaxID=3019445 RepID=UPI0023E8ACA6|nr:GntR family transcriptional regulator [Paracoccus sp. DMF-8]MDF3606692.1 GntR family transcriptional regulator [Paracoccus sp. DMF-8]
MFIFGTGVKEVARLPSELAQNIADLIRVRGWKKGMHLPERLLAEELRVSESPIRGALKTLAEAGLLTYTAGEGYVIEAPERREEMRAEGGEEDATYLQIASDRMEGRIAGRMSESELMRRYGLSRANVLKILSRIASEGWIERLPGNGWEFLPMLTSEDAYRQSFRFRLLNEPAAILEPTFVLNEAALLACREQQQALIAGDVHRATAADLFEINSRLHETILECSNNSFIIDSVKRINRLRRLMELGSKVERTATVAFCHEHVQILDLLLENRRTEAADALRLHLGLVSRKKTGF